MTGFSIDAQDLVLRSRDSDDTVSIGDIVGDEVVGDEVVGDDVVGDEVVGEDVVGEEVVGEEVVGEDVGAFVTSRTSSIVIFTTVGADVGGNTRI